MISKLIGTAVFGTAWGLLAAGDTWPSVGVTAILAGAILWLVQHKSKRDRETTKAMGEATKATNHSAAAVEELTRELQSQGSLKIIRRG